MLTGGPGGPFLPGKPYKTGDIIALALNSSIFMFALQIFPAVACFPDEQCNPGNDPGNNAEPKLHPKKKEKKKKRLALLSLN